MESYNLGVRLVRCFTRLTPNYFIEIKINKE